MPARSIVTFVEPSRRAEDTLALDLALGWAGGLDARVVVLAFPADVGRGAADDIDPAQVRAQITAQLDAGVDGGQQREHEPVQRDGQFAVAVGHGCT